MIEYRDIEYQIWWSDEKDPFPFSEESWVFDDYFTDKDKALRRIAGYIEDDQVTKDFAKYIIRTKYIAYSYEVEVIE